jgi:isopentenyl diphosphate isomerase/L-lactate dehydrogenase-like FMN-dependent dehydrogenase
MRPVSGATRARVAERERKKPMSIACVSDLRERARRRLPKFVFDYLDGGAGSEAGVLRNERAFDALMLEPRALVNIETRDISTRFLGRRWAAPFGIAPIGLGNFIWPRAEEAIARAAAAADIPYVLSTAGTTKLERIAEIAPRHAWFQLYVSKRGADTADLVNRVERAGYEVLMLTVDVPLAARRLRDIRNNFTVPFRLTPRVLFQLLARPVWFVNTLAAGLPNFVNVEPYAPIVNRQSLAAYLTSEIGGRFDWDELEKLRGRWRRKLIVKGLLSAEDCQRARDMGCDAVVISNHGGRQLDCAPATIDVLPEIRAAVGAEFPLIIDSGVRSGEHVVKALAAGADFVLIGRAMMYAVAAYGTPGAEQLIELIADETSRCLGQIGFCDIKSLRRAAPVLRPGQAT